MFNVEARNQILASFCVCLLALGVGASISWTSPYLPLLKSDESPLGNPITTSQASKIGSALSVGALIGTFLFGWLSERLGRRLSLIFSAIPNITWWMIVIYATEPEWLYLGRFLAGMTVGASFMLAPMFSVEISQDKFRGPLGSLTILAFNSGMLSMFISGHFLSYHTTPKIMILLPTFFLLTFTSFFHETPIYLLRHGKIAKAEKSFLFYRNCKSGEVLGENFEIEKQSMISKVNKDATSVSSGTLNELRKPSSRKAIFIGVVLISINQLTGLFTFLNYTAKVFTDAGSLTNPNTSSIAVGALTVLGSLLSVVIIAKYSRKCVYLTTTIIYLIGLLVIAAFGYFSTIRDLSHFKYLPVICLSTIVFIACVGRLPINYIVLAEIMPQNIRSFGVSLATAINWILSSLILQYFATLVEAFGFHGCMLLFAFCSFLGILFMAFYVPETKNKSFEEIERSLSN